MDIFKKEYLLEQVNKLKNKQYEVSFIAPLLMDEELSTIKPYTQFEVLNRRYKIDLYYEQISLAIEIYENFHEYQLDGDEKRIKAIKKHLNCDVEILKVSEVKDLFAEIKRLKQLILKKVKQQKDFEAWHPVSHTMAQVQEDYGNAIFFKAPKDNEFDVLNPLRGPILVSDEIRDNANLFVTYSGDTPTIVSVFEVDPKKWKPFNANPVSYFQYGQEIVDHPLISSGMTQWNTTSNRFYGNSLKKKKGHK